MVRRRFRHNGNSTALVHSGILEVMNRERSRRKEFLPLGLGFEVPDGRRHPGQPARAGNQSPPSLVGVIVEKPSSCVWSTRRINRVWVPAGSVELNSSSRSGRRQSTRP